MFDTNWRSWCHAGRGFDHPPGHEAASAVGQMVPCKRSFDDLGTPLADVTFCVLDLETTGGDRTADAITEVGAVKVRGGECLGTFQTLVNPGRAIPPRITLLTGLTDALVAPAPRIEAVLPSLLEFLRGTILVGHNIGFDVAFLRRALRAGRPRPVRSRARRHRGARPPSGARRGARLPPRHFGVAVPARPHADPSSPRRRVGDDRPAAPAHRAGDEPRRVRDRRPDDAGVDGRPPAGRRSCG